MKQPGMKLANFKSLILSIIVFSQFIINPFKSHSQEFAPVGAKWVYSELGDYAGGWRGTLIREVKSVSKAIINKRLCSKLDIEGIDVGFESYYVYTQNDSIFYYHSVLDSFLLLMNMNAKVGDTIINYELAAETVCTFEKQVIVVDSIYDRLFSGDTLKSFDLRYVSIWDQPTTTFTKYLGDFRYLIFGAIYPVCYTDANYPKGLRCYTDSLRHYETELTDSCYQTEFVKIEEKFDGNRIRIYPNPTRGILKVNFDSHFEYEVVSIKGEVVQKGSNQGNTIILNFNLRNGVYWLRIITEKKQFVSKVLLHR